MTGRAKLEDLFAAGRADAAPTAAFMARIEAGELGDKGRERDKQMSKARRDLDWQKQFELALFPDDARAIRASRTPEDEDTCTMCGDFCASRGAGELFRGDLRGELLQFVDTGRRAWHAGKSEWNGHKDVNGCSIGLCFSNKNDAKEPLTDAQKAAMKTLIADVRRKYGHIPVTTHAAVSPGRKNDPDHVPGFVLKDYE